MTSLDQLLLLSLWPEWIAKPWRFEAGPRLWRGARSVLERLARTPRARPPPRIKGDLVVTAVGPLAVVSAGATHFDG